MLEDNLKNRNFDAEAKFLTVAQFALLAGTAIVSPLAAIAGVTGAMVEAVWNYKFIKPMLAKDMLPLVYGIEVSNELGDKIKNLYDRAGINHDEYKLYDGSMGDSKSRIPFANDIKSNFNIFSKSINASVFNVNDKAIVTVSRSLMRTLNDDEVVSVVAHEFAHFKSRKNILVDRFLENSVKVANNFRVLGSFLEGGVLKAAASLAPAFAFWKGSDLYRNKVYKYFNKNNCDIHDHEETRVDLRNKKIIMAGKWAVEVASVAIAGLFVPAVPAIWAVSKVTNIASRAIGKLSSRIEEYRADRDAVEKFGASPVALMIGLRKISYAHDANKERYLGHNLPKKGKLAKAWKEINSSHPDVVKRINRLGKIAIKQGYSEEEVFKAKIHDVASKAYLVTPYSVVKDSLGLNYSTFPSV